jgi:hypothetical protein
MPATPFRYLFPNANLIAGFAVIPLAYIMYRIADLLDVLPKGGQSGANREALSGGEKSPSSGGEKGPSG